MPRMFYKQTAEHIAKRRKARMKNAKAKKTTHVVHVEGDVSNKFADAMLREFAKQVLKMGEHK